MSDATRLRGGRHVFIFGVCGRSSTTALMRILNSSREICVWGEPGANIVDDFMDLIAHLQVKTAAPDYEERTTITERTFAEDDHALGHPMASPRLEPSIRALISTFCEMFRPVIDVPRFGFKEITVRGVETLLALQRVFPRARLVFLFRDPRTQWPSVERMQWWYSERLDAFLAEYERLAEIYMACDGLFVETITLRDPVRLQRLLDVLEIGPIDDSLIDDGVFAMRGKDPLSVEQLERIERSAAFTCFGRMQARGRALVGG